MNPTSPAKHAITLDQVAALGDEIAALIKSGVPLERGLSELSADLSGGMGDLTARLSERLQAGETLDTALEAESAQLPATTQAIIRAGLRSGQLSSALESYTALARRISGLRNTAGLALLYPAFLILLSWMLFWMYVVVLMPRISSLEEMQGSWQSAMQRLANTASIWGPVGPVVLIGGLGIWWFVSRRSSGVDPRMRGSRLGWIPSARRIAVYNQQAIFAETLASLLEHRVPLGEALTLAGKSSGSDRLMQGSEQLATAVESGEPVGKAVGDVQGLPPLVIWLLQTAPSPESLIKGLRHARESYLEKAENLTRWLTITLPILLTIFLGGSAVLSYTLAVLLPWFQALRSVVTG